MARLNTFRRVAVLEEQMIRSMMPKTSAADPLPLAPFASDGTPATKPAKRVFTFPLTYTLAEAARG